MIRRLILNLTACMFLAGMVLTAYAIATAPSATPDSIIYTNPKPVHTMPACITEDGAGQAVCWWNAQRQGNGQGEGVLSGDCAYEAETTRTMCITLHSQGSHTITNEDGSSNTVPNGVDLVGECQEEWQIGREWNDQELQECFKASMQ